MRRVICSVGLALVVVLAGVRAQAADWPAKPIHLIVPFAPGGAADVWARIIGDHLQTALKQSVVVENRGGAGGTVGLAQFVNNAKGDGNQLMVMGMVMVGAILTNKAPVGLDAVTPVARLTGEALVVAVPANSPHKSIRDLAAAL